VAQKRVQYRALVNLGFDKSKQACMNSSEISCRLLSVGTCSDVSAPNLDSSAGSRQETECVVVLLSLSK
jgi:hypothetical protein